VVVSGINIVIMAALPTASDIICGCGAMGSTKVSASEKKKIGQNDSRQRGSGRVEGLEICE
jgi:hypothetical protein